MILASFPSPPQGVWYLGPVPLRAYALFIIVGIVAALVLGDRRWQARGGEKGVVYDVALWAVPFGLVGGRLYHVLTDWTTYFGPDGRGLAAALRVWEGGLGIWGAVALGAVGAWIGCRMRGVPLPALGDAVAPGVVLAQAIGRLGNYFNQELYGRETSLPWGLEIFVRQPDSLDGVAVGAPIAVVHPTFLYELLWNLLVFAMLLVVDRRLRLGHGRLFALYVAAYCVGRFGVELLRDDTATLIAGVRINSFTATFVFIGAVVYLLAAPRGREDVAAVRGEEEPAAEEPAVAAVAGVGVVSVADAESLRPDPVPADGPPAGPDAMSTEPVDERPHEENGVDVDHPVETNAEEHSVTADGGTPLQGETADAQELAESLDPEPVAVDGDAAERSAGPDEVTAQEASAIADEVADEDVAEPSLDDHASEAAAEADFLTEALESDADETADGGTPTAETAEATDSDAAEVADVSTPPTGQTADPTTAAVDAVVHVDSPHDSAEARAAHVERRDAGAVPPSTGKGGTIPALLLERGAKGASRARDAIREFRRKRR